MSKAAGGMGMVAGGGGADDAEGGGESVASEPVPEDIPRLNFGLNGFMQV